ncbi:hypothetical protein [Clostridium estertheticum]|nr:hypothetical protein [Clostridium estertheticum]MCB2354706.1 hypothetical protein [Clostridium estertheticum]WAG40950.1 hypothetical protein LL065_22335 [Clostridium estertheticum]
MSEIENIDETKITVDTEKILKKATDLKEEIEIPTLVFYSDIEDIKDVKN